MKWVKGFSPCMELGVDGCVVWWDAWVVVLASMALMMSIAAFIVAWWGVIATAASGYAVWRLGKHANHLAESGSRSAQIERESQAAVRRSEREKEEKILLAYVRAELDSIYPSIAVFAQRLDEPGSQENFVTDFEYRAYWAGDFSELQTPRLESCLGRLHQLPSVTGTRLARILGDIQTIASILTKSKDFKITPGDDPDEICRKARWLQAMDWPVRDAGRRAGRDVAACCEAARKAYQD